MALTRVALSMTQFEGMIVGQQTAMKIIVAAIAERDKKLAEAIRHDLQKAADQADDELEQKTLRDIAGI